MLHIILLGLTLTSTCVHCVQPNNLEYIVEFVNRLQTTWEAKSNFGSDASIESIKRMLGKIKSNFTLPVREEHVITDSELPGEFDARQRWKHCPTISSIRNQGNCGSCWAVASASVFSDRLCISTEANFTKALSAEEVLTCCEFCGRGCNGGSDFSAWMYFGLRGLVTGGEYQSNTGCQPYEIEACGYTESPLPLCNSLPPATTPKCHRECTNPSYVIPYMKDHYRVKRSYTVRNNETEIRKELMVHGPVVASLNVYSDFLTYKKGVYQHIVGEKLGRHVVRIIGWGSEKDVPYWLISNSWSTYWGENGVFKIKRGVNECDIESEITAGIPLKPFLNV